MSFGATESVFGGPFNGGSETDFDPYLTTPAGHPGVTFVAGTGDTGQPGIWPAYSPTVVAVGGTILSLDTSNDYAREIGWSGSGGGISHQESQPSYQHGFVTQSTTQRTIP